MLNSTILMPTPIPSVVNIFVNGSALVLVLNNSERLKKKITKNFFTSFTSLT